MITTLTVAACALLCACAAYVHASFKVIPHGYVAAWERLGKFRGLLSGPNFMWLGVDRCRRVTWTFDEESSGGVRVPRVWRMNMLPRQVQQIDVMSSKGVSKDGLTVTVNGTLEFQIKDFQLAFYSVDDATRAMCTSIDAAVREICARKNGLNLIGSDRTISNDVTEYINEHIEAYGIVCIRFYVQEVSLPANIMAAREREQEAEHERAAEIGRDRSRYEIERTRADSAHQLKQLNLDRQNEAKRNDIQRKRDLSEATIEGEIAESSANKRQRVEEARLAHERDKEIHDFKANAELDEIERNARIARQRHEKALERLQLEIDEEKLRIKLYELKQEASARVARQQADATADRLAKENNAQYSHYRELGLSGDQITHVESERARSNAIQRGTKLILSESAMNATPFTPWTMAYAGQSADDTNIEHRADDS